MQRGKRSIFVTFGGHLGFLRKMKKYEYIDTVRDKATLSEFLTHRVVQECPVQRGKILIFATFGGHLGKCKSVNISKTVRDRPISSEFLSRRVVQESPVKGVKWIFATFCSHHGFLRKMKRCEYLGKDISSL